MRKSKLRRISGRNGSNSGHKKPPGVGRFQTVEKPQGERERAVALSHFNRTRRRVRRGRAIFPAENLIFQRKNRFPAVSAPGNPLGFQRRLEGVAVAGEILPRPPACQKDFFDKLPPRPVPGRFLGPHARAACLSSPSLVEWKQPVELEKHGPVGSPDVAACRHQ